MDRMISEQIIARGITNSLLINALKSVDRMLFVPAGYRKSAYSDFPLPIGFGQTISQPYIVAYMIDQLSESGRMIIPVGSPFGIQYLYRITKKNEELERERLIGVRFVPFVSDQFS